MATTIKVLIDAKGAITGTDQIKSQLNGISNQANKTKKELSGALDLKVNVPGLDKAQSAISGISKAFTGLKTLAVGGAIGTALISGISTAIDKSVELENSLKGVESVARSFGASTDAVKRAILDFTSDGLVGATEATQAFKQVLSTGTDLPTAIKLLNSLKDTATFNRQAFYSLGEAIVATTEGIKNGNSVRADAVGVTKNLSVLEKEYASSLGLTVGQLTETQKIQARVNGFIREGAFATGDAQRAMDTYSGQLSRLGTSYDRLLAKIGDFSKESLGLKSVFSFLADYLDKITINKDSNYYIAEYSRQLERLNAQTGTLYESNTNIRKQLEAQIEKIKEVQKLEVLRTAQGEYEAKLKRDQLKAQKDIEDATNKQLEAQSKLRKELENVGLTQTQILQKQRAEGLKIAGSDVDLRLKVEKRFYEEKAKLDQKLHDENIKRIRERERIEKEIFDALSKASSSPFASIRTPEGLNESDKAKFEQRTLIGRGAGIGNLISEGAEGAKKLVTGVASTAINAIVPGLGDALGPLISSLTAGPEATREFVRAFTGAIPDLVQGLIEAIPVLIEELANQFPIVIERLAERADDIILALVKATPKVAVALANSMPMVAVQFSKSLIESIPNIVGAMINGLAEGIKKLFENLLGGGENGFLGGGSGLTGTLKDKALGGILGGSLGGVVGAGNYLSAITNPGQFFSSFASDPLGSIGNIFGFASGGEIKSVRGGIPFSDSVPAKLQSGELVADRSLTSDMKKFFDNGNGQSGESDALARILDAVNRPLSVSTSVSLNQKAFADIILNLNRTNQRLV